MYQLLCFVAGVACALGAAALVQRRRRSAQRPTAPAGSGSASLTRLGRLYGTELAQITANLVGRADLLCESLQDRDAVVVHGAHLLHELQHLALFSQKLICLEPVSHLSVQGVELAALLRDLAARLEDDSAGNLRVTLELAKTLPQVVVNPTGLRNAILLLVEAMLHLDPTAHRLQFRARTRFEPEHKTAVWLELQADADEHDSQATSCPESACPELAAFGRLAATHLLEGQGCALTFCRQEHLPASYCISIPTGDGGFSNPRHERDDEPEISIPRSEHPFGGVLLLDQDGGSRHLLAAELKGSGRNIVACADGPAARALFGATPERFELLVIDLDTRRAGGLQLASAAITAEPELLILLTTVVHSLVELPAELRTARVAILRKPFEIRQLRAALAALLTQRTCAVAQVVESTTLESTTL